MDTISSLGSVDYRHDEWGVDVTVGGSQKGLMLPPGLGFNAVGEKAMAAANPQSAFSFTSLEGYIAAQVLVEGLRRSGKDLTREKLADVWRGRRYATCRRRIAAWQVRGTICEGCRIGFPYS